MAGWAKGRVCRVSGLAQTRGQDEIALTLEYEQAILAHESRRAAEMPWLT